MCSGPKRTYRGRMCRSRPREEPGTCSISQEGETDGGERAKTAEECRRISVLDHPRMRTRRAVYAPVLSSISPPPPPLPIAPHPSPTQSSSMSSRRSGRSKKTASWKQSLADAKSIREGGKSRADEHNVRSPSSVLCRRTIDQTPSSPSSEAPLSRARDLLSQHIPPTHMPTHAHRYHSSPH